MNKQKHYNNQKMRTHKRVKKLLIVSALFCFGVTGITFFSFGKAEKLVASYFVATNGSPNGNGSINQPWDLQTALNNKDVIKPGDLVLLRQGRYGLGGSTTFTSNISGAINDYVTIKNYNGELATIDGNITVNGNYTQWWGFEVTNSMQERVVASNQRVGGFSIFGLGTKVINCIIHDTGHPAIGFWRTVGDSGELYGNIIWGTGIFDTNNKETARGSPIYAQNEVGNRLIQDNITFRNFTTAMKAYTENSYANNFTIDGNTSFDNGDVFGIFAESIKNPINRINITNNNVYTSPSSTNSNGITVGLYDGILHGDLKVENNYIANQNNGGGMGLHIKSWQNNQVNNNTIIAANKGAILRIDNEYLDKSSINIDNNTYYSNANRPFQDTELQARLDSVYSSDYIASTQTIELYKNGRGEVTGSKHDKHSQIYSDFNNLKNAIFVRPNKFENSRANITVYNWEEKTTEQINPSNILKVGQNYEIKDAQNILGAPIATGTYTGQPINLPLEQDNYSPIQGNIKQIVTDQHTPKTFNCFVILGLNESNSNTNTNNNSSSSNNLNNTGGSSIPISPNNKTTKGASIRIPIKSQNPVTTNNFSAAQIPSDTSPVDLTNIKNDESSLTNNNQQLLNSQSQSMPKNGRNNYTGQTIFQKYGWVMLWVLSIITLVSIAIIYIKEYRHTHGMQPSPWQ